MTVSKRHKAHDILSRHKEGTLEQTGNGPRFLTVAEQSAVLDYAADLEEQLEAADKRADAAERERAEGIADAAEGVRQANLKASADRQRELERVHKADDERDAARASVRGLLEYVALLERGCDVNGDWRTLILADARASIPARDA